jgi:hypothetical protein
MLANMKHTYNLKPPSKKAKREAFKRWDCLLIIGWLTGLDEIGVGESGIVHSLNEANVLCAVIT